MNAVSSRSVWRWPQDHHEPDPVAVEEPLQVRLEGEALAVLLRTPGHDRELVAGFLYSEGIVERAEDLAALRHVDPGEAHTVEALLAGGVRGHLRAQGRSARSFLSSSACGSCGKETIEQLLVAVPPLAHPWIPDPALVVSLPAALRQAQSAFQQTGGLHAAALFDRQGGLEVIREDVGRHNAVDKVLGSRVLADALPVQDRLLVVSSRAGFEIVQKALVARIPALATVGAASTMAADLAKAGGMALYGFVRDGRLNRYA